MVAESWSLLGDLLERGPAARREDVQRVPSLAEVAPEPDDEAEAWFHQLFSREVQPFASAVLEPNRCLGGEVTRGLWDRMEGFSPSLDADHLAAQCHFLAWTDDQERARILLAEGMLPWLPVVTVAVREVDPGFWGRVLSLVHELAIYQAGPVEALPRLEPLGLDDPSLRELAEALVTPVRCGAWLTLHTLNGLGESLELPRGFGTRARTLETLLRSAVHRGRLGELLDGLEAHFRATSLSLHELPGATAWALRCEHTADTLAALPRSP